MCKPFSASADTRTRRYLSSAFFGAILMIGILFMRQLRNVKTGFYDTISIIKIIARERKARTSAAPEIAHPEHEKARPTG
jgi:hypothetical protein